MTASSPETNASPRKRFAISLLLGSGAIVLVALAVVVVVWGVSNRLPPTARSLPQPLGAISLPLILLGLAGMNLNEIRYLWPARQESALGPGRDRFFAHQHPFVRAYVKLDRVLWPQGTKSIFRAADDAFNSSRRSVFVAIYLSIGLAIGALTMHFTRAVTADWAFLAAVVLVLVNGALIAYWLETAVPSKSIRGRARGGEGHEGQTGDRDR